MLRILGQQARVVGHAGVGRAGGGEEEGEAENHFSEEPTLTLDHQ